MPKKTTRKHVGSEGREIIAKVYHFLKSEAQEGVYRLTDARWRTSQATGVSEATISRILREERNLASTSGKFLSPLEKRKQRFKTLDIDYVTTQTIRKTIQAYMTQNQSPSLENINQVLKQTTAITTSISTLRKLLITLGYRWRENLDKRKILTERHDIQMLRLNYLKKIRQHRSEGRSIVYTGEIYIDIDHLRNINKANGETADILKKFRKGSRFIVLHAGTETDLIQNALLIHKIDPTIGENHASIDIASYLKWTESLLPNLPENSVIVMNNAAHHNVKASFVPTFEFPKEVMQRWLQENDIAYEEDMTRLELFDLINKNKDARIRRKINETIRSYGHEILRLPLYHPELNVMEGIWMIMKSYIATKNLDEMDASVANECLQENLVRECLGSIDSAVWVDTCRRVQEMEREYAQFLEMDLNLNNDTS